jgi:uncharacterized protein (DUF1501 family)
MLTRRQFVASSGSLISTASLVPTMLCRAAQTAPASRDDRVLVVIQLDGGNDGLNTVVPYVDDAYARARPKLHIPSKDVHKLTDSLGLHPRMRGAKQLYDDSLLSIVQGVGYPNPDRSHFRSMRIWQTARFDDAAHDAYGWIGGAFDRNAAQQSGGETSAVYVGEEQIPVALWGRRSEAAALLRIDDLSLSRKRTAFDARDALGNVAKPDSSLSQFVTRQVVRAHAAADRLERQQAALSKGATFSYPDTALAARLRLVSQLLASGSPARVYYTVQGGYDTHAAQTYTHGQLLSEFSQALKAFLDDLARSELGDRVVVLAFSEFGRRAQENGSLGTDHGSAAPVFLAGKSVRPGMFGQEPRLNDLDDSGDLKSSLDFRQVYATLLESWLGIPSEEPLGGRFETLPLFGRVGRSSRG